MLQYPFECEKCGVLRSIDQPHYCFVQPYWFLERMNGKEEEEPMPVRYCFYDIETTQDSVLNLDGIEVY